MNKKTTIILVIIITAVLSAVICYIFLPRPAKNVSISVPEIKYAQILFVGDLMFDRGIRYYARQNGGNDFIFDKISSTLAENDLVVANLEGPITNNKSISSGTIAGSTNNYFFTFDPSVAKTMFDKNIKIVNLGNNHILNFGRDGLAQTKNYLDNEKVGYFGASDYPKSISTEINGIKITLISYNEFADLPEDVNQKSIIEEIQKAKGFSDVIIVYSHWGVEYSLTATNQIRDLAHQFIDAGANLIIGSHPHVIEPIEVYKEKRIYYSLGNFIFDQYFSEDVRNGLGVEVIINKDTKQLDFSEKHFYLGNNGQTIIKD
ncbi:MAG: CapA family protein [Candidatus Staskawiczbacteria bacterium]|nr:CapA family protein [Candidatus Staskawiczbacteria bacterium]